MRKGHRVGRNFLHTAATRFTYQVHTRCGRTFPGDSLKIEQGHQTVTMHARTLILRVSLNHDGTDGTDGSDGTGIQSVLPVPSASVAGPSVPSVSNSRSN